MSIRARKKTFLKQKSNFGAQLHGNKMTNRQIHSRLSEIQARFNAQVDHLINDMEEPSAENLLDQLRNIVLVIIIIVVVGPISLMVIKIFTINTFNATNGPTLWLRSFLRI